MGLRTVATFDLGETKAGESEETLVQLNIALGSVIYFKAPSDEKTLKQSNEKVDKEKAPEPPSSGIAAVVEKSALEKSEMKPPAAVPPGGIAALVAAQAAKKLKVSESSPQASSARVGAIVNAANERCLGGGGVDGAINNAGGYKLWKDREALPVLSEHEVRCRTGDAVVTGPNRYGSLRVNYVVHAVGPAYFRYTDLSDEEDSDSEMNDDSKSEFTVPDALLRSSYQESLERCRENGITDVAFSLLSAGVFRGRRSLNDVLTIGVIAIRDWVTEQETVNSASTINEKNGEEVPPPPYRLRSITLCGFSKTEVIALVKVCRSVFESDDTESE